MARAYAKARKKLPVLGAGAPLPLAEQQHFGRRLGHDLSSVRIHTGVRAEHSARSINARAYTLGSDIVFESGQSLLSSGRGKALLAHELAHVIQQGAAPRLPSSMAEPHASWPSLKAVSRRVMRRRLRRPRRSAPRPFVPAAKDFAVLRRGQYKTPAYHAVVNRWPSKVEIWPYLNSRKAREAFLRYVVKIDTTQTRKYRSFTNRCTGAAAQIFLRYSKYSKLTTKHVKNLQRISKVQQRNPPSKKLLMPLFVAIVPGHAFNAILVGTNANDINSYLFLEPQDDTIFAANSITFKSRTKSYGRFGALSLQHLTAFSSKGAFSFNVVKNFVYSARYRGFLAKALTDPQRVGLHGMLASLFVADDWDSWRVTVAEKHGQINLKYLTRANHSFLFQTNPQIRRRRYVKLFKRSAHAAKRSYLNKRYDHIVKDLFMSYIKKTAASYSAAVMKLAYGACVNRKISFYHLGPDHKLSKRLFRRLTGRSIP